MSCALSARSIWSPLPNADITNTIIYGLGTDISHGDLEGLPVTLRRCLLKSAGSNDDNFIDCLWESDPLFGVVLEEYIFDYRVAADSPALNAADPSLLLPGADTDLTGASRLPSPSLGAYQLPRE